jgi:hypothetical protein
MAGLDVRDRQVDHTVRRELHPQRGLPRTFHNTSVSIEDAEGIVVAVSQYLVTDGVCSVELLQNDGAKLALPCEQVMGAPIEVSDRRSAGGEHEGVRALRACYIPIGDHAVP